MSLLTDEELSELWENHIVPVLDKKGINPIVYGRAVMVAYEKKLSEQEPVAWWNGKETAFFEHEFEGTLPPAYHIPLYTHPAQPKSEWISVEDRLPESRDEMLCLFVKDSGKTYVGTSSLNPAKTGFYVEYSFDEPIERVTHWQHLPSPPEAK